jgi:tryptophan synthase alpha chain
MNDTNRILDLFNDNEANSEKYFMPFLVCGDPSIEKFISIVEKIDPYIDILELGIPFSDPIADGPTVQEANMRAFEAGINTKVALDIIKKIRTFFTKPIVILTYYNILIQGSETIESSLDITLRRFKESGIDGIVIADLPIEEAGLALKYCKKHNISLIFLIAPTTTDDRLEKILEEARGFVYLISVLGVTGAREKIAQITKETIKRVKQKIKTKIPVFLGFGISKPEHASAVAELGADGIIIGSAIINIIKKNLGDFNKMEQELVEFVSNIKNAIKRSN